MKVISPREGIPAAFGLVPNTQYLGAITGRHRDTATVQITFPGGPAGTEQARGQVSNIKKRLTGMADVRYTASYG